MEISVKPDTLCNKKYPSHLDLTLREYLQIITSYQVSFDRSHYRIPSTEPKVEPNKRHL